MTNTEKQLLAMVKEADVHEKIVAPNLAAAAKQVNAVRDAQRQSHADHAKSVMKEVDKLKKENVKLQQQAAQASSVASSATSAAEAAANSQPVNQPVPPAGHPDYLGNPYSPRLQENAEAQQ